MFRPSETTEVWKRPTITSLNSFMAQEIYGDRDSVRYKEWRPRTSEENIERVRQAFQRFPMKSIGTAARQLKLPRSTVNRVSSILTSIVSLGLNI